MADNPNIDDLALAFDAGAFRRALEEAYRRGEEAGVAKGEAVMRSRLEALLHGGAPAKPTREPVDQAATGKAKDTAEEGGETASRAPRGLTREVIMMILSDKAEQTTDQIQSQAVAFDERLSSKTVYNELIRERDKLYRQTLGKWSLIQQQGASAIEHDHLENLLE